MSGQAFWMARAITRGVSVPLASMTEGTFSGFQYWAGEAGEARGKMPSMLRAVSKEWNSTTLSSNCQLRDFILADCPVDMLSYQQILCPRCSNSRHRCAPRNPAAPRTRNRLGWSASVSTVPGLHPLGDDFDIGSGRLVGIPGVPGDAGDPIRVTSHVNGLLNTVWAGDEQTLGIGNIRVWGDLLPVVVTQEAGGVGPVRSIPA